MTKGVIDQEDEERKNAEIINSFFVKDKGKIDRDQQERLTRLIRRRFGDNSVKVIFLPNDAPCPVPPTEYLDYDPDLRYYIGYIVLPSGAKIPFVAEVIPYDTAYVYLNPHKDFYLAFMIGDLD